ncbi:MAG: hypothetical protein QOH06_1249 [Acidobacteriota bacterium]|jgi:ribosomal protein L28|nr:hypothetical protein [Acidobacteriota bacterium]
MKKKTAKKLVLSKETLRSLEETGGLKQVVGGSRVQTNCVVCESGFYTCPSAAGGCPSYLC